jgi:hypothetical protein
MGSSKGEVENDEELLFSNGLPVQIQLSARFEGLICCSFVRLWHSNVY